MPTYCALRIWRFQMTGQAIANTMAELADTKKAELLAEGVRPADIGRIGIVVITDLIGDNFFYHCDEDEIPDLEKFFCRNMAQNVRFDGVYPRYRLIKRE